MNKKLYVGNLNYSITSDELKQAFGDREITDCKVIESKGFAFVTFANAQDASSAKEELNNFEFKGRPMKLDFAEDRSGGSRSGGSNSGFQKRRF